MVSISNQRFGKRFITWQDIAVNARNGGFQ